MVKVPALFLSDEEMGKKDDDHRERKNGVAATWSPATQRMVQQPRKTIKRVAILALVLFLIYQFIVNIPTDVPIRDRRRPDYGHSEATTAGNGARKRPPPNKAPGGSVFTPGSKRAHGMKGAQQPGEVYNGRGIKFPSLGDSLHGIAETRGSYKENRNVLFCAASLESLATLLPIACQMGQELRSYVHFVLMSRSDIDLSQLQDVNGVDESCRIIYHDARPDNSARSTNERLAEAATKAFVHINHYMHPQAIIVDNSAVEEKYFMAAVKNYAKVHQTTLIEMPSSGLEKLSWMTKLDSTSLAAWNQVTIEIIIHATPGASGSLTRLLKSLQSADYGSSSVPQITIDLPQMVDAPTEELLHRFMWPPGHASGSSSPHQLSLRHRIAKKWVNDDESSVRFLESFWPARPQHSHVLLLLPEAELSSNFFHYLKYVVLEYRYSNAAILQQSDKRLFGISLVSPDTYLNGSGPFEPPTSAEAALSGGSPLSDSPPSFLWQGPINNAVLIFGSKWVELHGFVSQVLDVQGSTGGKTSELLSQKIVSKQFPAWLEHALRLCRARNYFTLYPGPAASPRIATIHTELKRPPEEYEDEQRPEDHQNGGEAPVLLSRGPLLDTILEGKSLPPLYELPFVSWDGETMDAEEHEARASKYTADFRLSVGGCEAKKGADPKPDKMAADLFCAV